MLEKRLEKGGTMNTVIMPRQDAPATAPSGGASYCRLAGHMAVPQSMIERMCTPAERHQMIAQAAYFLAQSRGFQPGHALQDWLAAEHSVDSACGLIEPHSNWDAAGR